MPAKLVVDCSVAAKWLLPEPGRDMAMRLLEKYEAGEVSLIAPDLLLAEFASLLAKRTRRKEISNEEAQKAFRLMEKCAPRLFNIRIRLHRALDLALQYQLSLWDCIYLELAIEHECPFITSDLRLFRGSAARHPLIRLLS